MKIRRPIQQRKVMLSLLMCCLLATLAACTVNIGSPPPGTPIGGDTGVVGTAPQKNSSGSPQTTQGTSIPLSRYLIINAGATYYAIDATTGTVIWNLQNSSFTTTPVVANGQIYALKQAVPFSGSTGPTQIVDIDEQSGAQHWSYSLGQVQPLYAFMALAGNVVVAEIPNVGLIGVNAQNGAKMWQVALSATYVSGTTGMQTSGNVVYIPTTNSLDAFDATTGHILWQQSNAFQVAGAPGAAFVYSSCTSYFTLMCLNAYNPSSGAQQWSSPVGVKECGSNNCVTMSNNVEPFVGGNVVYSLFAAITNSSQVSTEDSYIDAFNARIGALLWEYSIPNSHGQIGANSPNFNVVGADSSAVYYENSVGTITALSATNHAALWKYVNPNGQATQFIESQGAIELLNGYTVTALNPQTGAQMWATQL